MLPYADTAAMEAFLDRFSETLAEDEHAAMVLDQAGWHGWKSLAVPANILNRLLRASRKSLALDASRLTLADKTSHLQ